MRRDDLALSWKFHSPASHSGASLLSHVPPLPILPGWFFVTFQTCWHSETCSRLQEEHMLLSFALSEPAILLYRLY